MAKVKKKSTKKKNDESSIYSGVAINIADDCKTSKKMVKDWTKIMNNNANSSPLYNDPQEKHKEKDKFFSFPIILQLFSYL